MDWKICVFILLHYIYCVHGGRPVYVSNGSHILSYSKDEARVHVVYGKAGFSILGLAVDFENNFLFWSDTSPEFKGIYRANLEGKNVATIVKDVQEVSDLSVDWVSNHIYWSDTKGKTIEVANYDGSARRVLVSRNLRGPRNIAVDPISGYVFWVDQRSKRIERSWLDGSHRRTLLKSKQYWPNQLAVSYEQRLLYWVDARKHAIFSCSFKGADIVEQRGLKSITKGAPAYGLVVFGNTAVISTWFSTALYSVLIGTDSTVWQLEARDLGTRELYSLISLHPATQPSRHHPCGDGNNGGCSHLCLPSKGQEFTCSCPTFGGLSLAEDSKTCQVPSHMLFVTLQQFGEVGFLSLDNGADADFSLVSKSTKPAAVTFDPVNQIVYWSDVSEKRIYSIHLDGTHKRVFLNSSDGIGTVQGMAFDWLKGRLYFTNVGHSGPSLDGTIYTWHRVEFVEVDLKKRKTLLHEVGSPVDIAIDLNNRYLYISEAGKHPKIIRTELGGQNPVTIKETGVLSGVAVSEGSLYFSGVDVELGGRVMVTYNTVDEAVEEAKLMDEASQSIAVSHDSVFYVDPIENYLIADNGTVRQQMLIEGRPLGLAYSVSSAVIDYSETDCYDSGCEEGCALLPWNKMTAYRCLCYDGSADILQPDEKTCARPSNFLLYADMTTINMISLDPDTEVKPVVLHHGDIGGNYVALTYDDLKERVYWSDHTSQAIYLSDLFDMSPIMLYKEAGFIEGLVIDPGKQRLYWTVVTSQTGSGYIARLNIDRGLGSYKRLQTSRSNPRAITLHPSGRWLYWTEHKSGSTGVEVYSCKTNGQRYRKLMSVDLHWPNSLVVLQDKVYIGDGRGKIVVSDIEGGHIHVLSDDTSTISHVFGLAVFKNVLVYSDWDTNSIRMMDMESDFRTSLVSNLTRPTAIVLHQSENFDNHVCFTDENPCSDICRPLLRGLHKCMCAGDRNLAQDQATCVEDVPSTTALLTTSSLSTTVTPELTVDTTEHIPPEEGTNNETMVEVEGDDVNQYGKDATTDGDERISEDYEDMKNNEETQNEDNNSKLKDEIKDDVFEDKDIGNNTIPDTATMEQGLDLDSVTENDIIQATRAKPVPTEIVTTAENMEASKEVNIGAAVGKDYEATTTAEKDYGEAGDNDWIEKTVDDIESLYEDGVQLEPIGPPYFEACPEDEEAVILAVPGTQSRVIYPMIPRAYDTTGTQLTVSSSHQLDGEGIHLEWEGEEEESHHKVTLWAVDSHNQEVVCEIHVILQDVDPPVFTFCPDNFKVTTSNNRETVHWLNPEAIDNVGVAVVNGSHAPGSSFPLGVNIVSYTATDRAGNQALCSFSIIVSEDVDPPVFTFCPNNVKVSTNKDRETVHWSSPETSDNVGVAVVNGSHTPGSSFPLGVNIVNYTATDKAGNQALCSFRIIVSEDQLCELPEIQHGRIVCNHGDDYEGECSVVCDEDFVVNPIRIFRRAFNCKHPDELESMTKAMKTQSPCLLRRYPSIVQKEFHLLFKGPVFKHRPQVLSYISTSVSEYLAQKKLCDSKACRIGNLTVYCGFGDTPCIEEESEQEKFYAVFNITMTNSTRSGSDNPDMLTVLEKIHQELMYLSSALSVQIEEHRYEAVVSAVSARQHTWSCTKGQIYEKSICIACPVGTYHNMTVDVCQFCSKGSYQDKEGQLYCFNCRPGQTSPDGATHQAQCNTIPSMDEMTLFIIVTACSFGVVFLCMAITLYLQFKRQQKRNEKAIQKKTRYNMSPNVYVAPPPILKSKLLDENASFGPRTYSIDKKHPFNIYANHDYEDVDGNHAINGPIYQNDTFRSSPANSLNFPSAESPSTDDLSMSTLSRENTFRNTSSPQFGVKRSQKAPSSSSPGPQRKMSRESTFSNNSPRMMRVQRTPSNEGPFLTQSPLLRLKLAAYNFNQDD